jgi:hypothetical protein
MFPVLIFKSQILLALFAFSCGWFGCGYAALCNRRNLVDFPTSPSSFSNLKSQILFTFSCGWFDCGYAALCLSVSVTIPTAT